MATLPTDASLTGATTTNAQQKTNFSAIRTFLADLLGTDSGNKAAARTALGAATAADFLQSLGASGYQKMPGGLILQWGITAGANTGSLVTVTFPTPFATAVYGVQLQYVDGAANTGAGRGNPSQVGVVNTTAFNFYHSGSANGCQFYWFAIGK